MINQDLPECLCIHDTKLSTALNTIRVSIEKFWDNHTLLSHYTKHGVDHSERIIEYIEKLLHESPNLLNKYERFTLLAAAYLHDIGMQSPHHAGLPQRETYSIEELEEVRAKHHLSSAQMIQERVAPKPEFSLGLESCQDFLSLLITLVKYHRKLDITILTTTSFAGKKINLPLLVAILRLCDELDKDFRRVNMLTLKLREIPIISKFHWWTCHFIKSVDIQDGLVELYFRFPKKFQQDDKVRKIFIEKTLDSIKKQLHEVYDILFMNSIKFHKALIKIKEIEYVSGLEKIPDDLLEHINNNILSTKDQNRELSIKTGCTWWVDGVPYSDEEEVVKCLNRIFQLVRKEEHLKALKKIKKCLQLTMTPRERMVFLLTAGNISYQMGKLGEAENYYMIGLEISEREDLQEIYGDDISFTRSAFLGNIGVIYSDKGDLDTALKYHQDALELDRAVRYKQGEASDLGNIGLIFQAKGDLDAALKYLQDGLHILEKNDLIYGKDIITKVKKEIESLISKNRKEK